jgi:hypothetical protein
MDSHEEQNLEILGTFVNMIQLAYQDALRTEIPSPQNVISFTGGGAEYTYDYSSAHTKSDEVSKTVDFDWQFGISGHMETEILSIGVTFESEDGFEYQLSPTVVQSNEYTTQTSVSFSLSDANPGDEFDVAVYKDPVYGTPGKFVHSTKLSSFMCND